MTLMAGSFDGRVPGKRCSYCKKVLPLRLFKTRHKEFDKCTSCRHGFTRSAHYPYDELRLGHAEDD